jgi:hypothetical protein
MCRGSVPKQAEDNADEETGAEAFANGHRH